MITTKGKTKLQIVDEILNALVNQGEQCTDSGGDCEYSDLSGRHCAVGFLLPEDIGLLHKFSGKLVTVLISQQAQLGPNQRWIRDHPILISRLQYFHDRALQKDRLKHGRIIEHIVGVQFKSMRDWVALGTLE